LIDKKYGLNGNKQLILTKDQLDKATSHYLRMTDFETKRLKLTNDDYEI